MVLFICYPKCSTCKKAKAWLTDLGIEFTERDIKENNPTKDELKRWYERSGYPLSKFFNTSGILYREMSLSTKLPAMTDGEKLELLASDGMLVKRPLLITDTAVIPGFKEEQWKKALFG